MTGLELKLKRIEAGLTQYGVAAVLGIPPATLSYYENGHRPLPPGMEERILAVIEAREKEGDVEEERTKEYIGVLAAKTRGGSHG